MLLHPRSSQFARFLKHCMASETWEALASAKGGPHGVGFEDLMDHFVVPYTRGTGCSIALLMATHADAQPQRQQQQAAATVVATGPGEVELTLSRASWAGASVVETCEKLERLSDGREGSVPSSTHVFFSTLCLYHPQDGAPGGLPMDTQLDLVLAAFFGKGAQPFLQ